jgi:hypothetical protein
MKAPRKDDLPIYDEDDAHRREVVCRMNGVSAAFVATLDRLGVKDDPKAVAGAAFAAYRDAALDAAARHQNEPHRTAARAQVKAQIDAREKLTQAIHAVRVADAGAYSDRQLAELTERRGGTPATLQALDLAVLAEDLAADLSTRVMLLHALDGRGEARTTRLRLFAERLVPVYTAATGHPVMVKASAYTDIAEPTGFAAFLIAACNLVSGVVPARSLVENVTKALTSSET